MDERKLGWSKLKWNYIVTEDPRLQERRMDEALDVEM